MSVQPDDSPRSESRFGLLGIGVRLRSDEPAFFEEFEKIFGSESLDADAPVGMEIDLQASGRGDGTFAISGDALEDPAAYFLSFSSPTIPIRRLVPSAGGWDRIALGPGEDETFRFRDGVCEFRKVERWPRILSHLVFLRLLRLRTDLIFFHAGSVAVNGQGVLLIGPKGTGKTTLSLALGSRGWPLLGDETAAYAPATRELVPFRRPVAIKRGPRAHSIENKLRELSPVADEEGIFRVPVDHLLPDEPHGPVPLRHMVFLEGFGETARLESVQPGREELAALQPLAASLVNQSPTQRVFEMIRILGGVTCWKLTAGDPDATAELLEKKVTES